VTSKQWMLISHAAGEPTPENFKLIDVEVPDLQDGEVLVRHHYLSLDPYMRGRMIDAKSYAQPPPLNEVMIGGTVQAPPSGVHDALSNLLRSKSSCQYSGGTERTIASGGTCTRLRVH
jgi:NADPH-dependent curcumin reductase CurA